MLPTAKECYNQALAALSGRSRAPPSATSAGRRPVEALTTGYISAESSTRRQPRRDRTQGAGLTGPCCVTAETAAHGSGRRQEDDWACLGTASADRVAAARLIADGQERDRRDRTLAGTVRRATVRTMLVRHGPAG